jgi:hypothetical protein
MKPPPPLWLREGKTGAFADLLWHRQRKEWWFLFFSGMVKERWLLRYPAMVKERWLPRYPCHETGIIKKLKL